MKKFIFKGLVFSLVLVLMHAFFLMLADGSTDNYYSKLSSKKQQSLVLGASRAFMGLVPTTIDSILSKNNMQSKMYNYAFTLNNSPYGKVYLNAIKGKVDTTTNDGVFILSVSPWSISIDTIDSAKELDKTSILFNMRSFSASPNLEYFYKKYSKGWGNIGLKRAESALLKKYQSEFTKKSGSWTYVDKQGWLEVFTSMDSLIVSKRFEKKVKSYLEIRKQKKISKERCDYLMETISYLQEFGNVYLVRLPVDREILNIENIYMDDFDTKIKSAIEKSSGYLDLTKFNTKYSYTDGNHLYKESSYLVSSKVATWILSKRNDLIKPSSPVFD